eukprot:11380295-Alexandrium_andersonii.AAC.1
MLRRPTLCADVAQWLGVVLAIATVQCVPYMPKASIVRGCAQNLGERTTWRTACKTECSK